MKSLTDKDRAMFKYITSSNDENIALVSSELDNEDVPIIAYIGEDEDGEATIRPLAILVNSDNIFERLKNPTEDINA